ncbi:histidine phosphatase family protein [Adhaeribacter sp. BT258]|uniref:Histidine phosphatase family protein n=1 Tax=Adhaeribacter terrigena TaxID=2793070 RepID=A0ABS1C5S7_9BACT|nr:histidine phosphatase family protein [Adhaeribacter terrigena]MBK0404740.1 histidine phosphatase family protein [Adhaeribacter terrigena]
MPVKKVYLIRHGQTDYNLQNIVQGSGVDAPLNATGHWQAEQFYNHYRHLPFDKVYTSVLQRAQQSVSGFIQDGIPHEAYEGLNEINWGSREGTKITLEEDLYYHNMIATWQAGNTHVPIAGGESPEDVARCQLPVLEMLKTRPEEKNVLVCMHGRAMRVFLCQILNYPLRCMDTFEHKNLGLYVLHYTGSFFRVADYLNLEHLKENEA